jgi:hypothetical protein
MKSIDRLSALWCYVITSCLCLVLFPTRTFAQQGHNAVCTSTTGCSTTLASAAFVDASAFCTASGCSGADLCKVINNALAALPTAGGVVDARGVIAGGPNSCSGTETPYVVSGQHTITTPSVILLPSGAIDISATWVIPDHSRIIGEGNNPSGSPVMGTYIVASGMTSGTVMMQMGSSSCDDGATGQCYGVSISNLTLDGSNGSVAINGIQNVNAGESSYVDHVNLQDIAGTSLIIGNLASGSGPYTNITINPMKQCGSSTVGVQLGDTEGQLTSTRGIHGMTATCPVLDMEGGGTGKAGILLDSPNNTLEDIHFEGFNDGIQVGSLSVTSGSISTKSNLILNVNGGTSNTDVMSNVVHVCSQSSCGNSNNYVSDLSIVGVSATRSCVTVQGTSISCNLTNVVQDDLTNTDIPFIPQLQTSEGVYVIGDASPGGVSSTDSYTKFANTPVAGSGSVSGIATWEVGSFSSGTPGSSCQSGSLFSNTGGTSSLVNTVWACSGGTWSAIK